MSTASPPPGPVVVARPSLAALVRDWFMPVAVVGLLLLVAYDRLAGKLASDPAPPAVAVDSAAIDLGRKYRADFDASGVAALDAVATSGLSNTADLARAQREALDAQLRAAWSPVAAELTRRFGPASNGSGPGTLGTGTATVTIANPEAVRAFYRNLADGWRKGAK